MNITKKIDRAFQWAGEKMGAEAKTSLSEDFKMMETEMALRYDGMERQQKAMSAYVKWLGRRGETFEDKEKGLPSAYLGRTMVSHGEDFEADSEFGNCLIAMGRANERVAGLQEHYVADATAIWLESLERSLAMMKEYQASRKKLENRRLAYDASISKMQKAKRDDFRIEEELRTNKAKYEESSEDVMRRMQDIRDAEVDSVRDLTRFLDAELDFHERCAEELRRVRRNWAGTAALASNGPGGGGGMERRPTGRSRSNTAHSYSERLSRSNSNVVLEEERELDPVRLPIRSSSRMSNNGPDLPVRPPIGRANTFQVGPSPDWQRGSGANTPANVPSSANVGSLRANLRSVSRPSVTSGNVFADDAEDTASGSGSPEWGDQTASPATSYGSLTRSASTLGIRKAPPPPPPSRAKKPAPPIPARREV